MAEPSAATEDIIDSTSIRSLASSKALKALKPGTSQRPGKAAIASRAGRRGRDGYPARVSVRRSPATASSKESLFPVSERETSSPKGCPDPLGEHAGDDRVPEDGGVPNITPNFRQRLVHQWFQHVN